jgi:hypothetical protein
VQEHDRLPVRIAAELPIEAVAVAHVEMTGPVRLDLRIEAAAAIGWHVHQKLNSS